MKLRGGQPPDMAAMTKVRQQLDEQAKVEHATLSAVADAREGGKPAQPKDELVYKTMPPTPRSGGFTLEVLVTERARPDSRIDWKRYDALLTAPREDVETAMYRNFDREDLVTEIGRFMTMLPTLGKNSKYHVHELYAFEAREQYQWRDALLKQTDRMVELMQAVGHSPALAGFPFGQLKALIEALDADISDLLKHHGAEITKKPQSTWSTSSLGPGAGSWGNWKPKPKFDDPTPAEQLPAPKILTTAQVSTVETAAKALAKDLGKPGLEEQIVAHAGGLGEARPDFERLLGSYAMLVDEAAHAVDYTKHYPQCGPDRAFYRARQHARPSPRNEQSRALLRGSLEDALASKDPTRALEQSLLQNFMREISVPYDRANAWKPTAAGVIEAIEGEALLPLRYFNELPSFYGYKDVFPEMRALFLEVSRAVVEGRLEDWKAGLPTSNHQLRLLSEEGRAAWKTPLMLEREIKDSKGQSVLLKTHEARGIERLWVTKNHTGSHGFDHGMGAPCLLAFLTNARTEAIIVDDPRWPQHAGRMYIRALETPDGKPVIFAEGMAKDNEYPCQGAAEETLIRHAITKAQAVGAELVLSGYAEESIKRMDLQGTWGQRHFVLTPTPLIEATVAFGPHDWVHRHTDVRSPNRVPFTYKGG